MHLQSNRVRRSRFTRSTLPCPSRVKGPLALRGFTDSQPHRAAGSSRSSDGIVYRETAVRHHSSETLPVPTHPPLRCRPRSKSTATDRDTTSQKPHPPDAPTTADAGWPCSRCRALDPTRIAARRRNARLQGLVSNNRVGEAIYAEPPQRLTLPHASLLRAFRQIRLRQGDGGRGMAGLAPVKKTQDRPPNGRPVRLGQLRRPERLLPLGKRKRALLIGDIGVARHRETSESFAAVNSTGKSRTRKAPPAKGNELRRPSAHFSPSDMAALSSGE